LLSTCPTLYGFVPRTYCAERVAELAVNHAAPVTKGDGDPLDICIFTDRPIMRGDILLEARPIGGLRMVERGEANDKILAVLIGNPTYGEFVDVAQLSRGAIDRLRHYFLTYKTMPGEPQTIHIDLPYGAERAQEVLRAAQLDYLRHFVEPVPE
jgi:inorganic pyrophosphatase